VARPGAVMKQGVCRWCRCTYWEPCPGSCGWADRAQTLCTECVDIEKAWKRNGRAQKPNMHRAFFRGFTAGAGDERAVDWGIAGSRGERAIASNPYRKGETALYWAAGFKAGAALRAKLDGFKAGDGGRKASKTRSNAFVGGSRL
jgi:hypothetical protein